MKKETAGKKLKKKTVENLSRYRKMSLQFWPDKGWQVRWENAGGEALYPVDGLKAALHSARGVLDIIESDHKKNGGIE